MTVLCVESTIVYADGVAAIAAEGGANKTFEVSGSVSFATTASSLSYPNGIVIRATSGEEPQDDGDINLGAKMTGTFTSTVTGTDIRDLRTNRLSLGSAVNAVLRRLIVDGLGADAVAYNDTIDAENIIIHNCDDGFISSVVRDNSIINKSTVIGAARFGYANGKVNNSVDVNSSNQGFFGERPGSTNLWENDGSGTNSITESPATDIFVNFSGGKYGLNATSSPAIAGAGAFIGTGGGTSVTINQAGQPQSIEQITLTQKSVVTIGGMMQPQSIEQVALSTISALSLNNLDVIQSVEEVSLSQAYLISVNPIAQAQSIDQVSLLVAGTLSVNDAVQGQQVEQTVLSVIASLSIDGLSNPQAIEQVILSAFNGSTVSINDVDQQQSIDEISLSQFNVVSVDDLSQSQLLESINFNGVVVGYLQGALTVISAYNGKIKLTNPLTGEIRIL